MNLIQIEHEDHVSFVFKLGQYETYMFNNESMYLYKASDSDFAHVYRNLPGVHAKVLEAISQIDNDLCFEDLLGLINQYPKFTRQKQNCTREFIDCLFSHNYVLGSSTPPQVNSNFTNFYNSCDFKKLLSLRTSIGLKGAIIKALCNLNNFIYDEDLILKFFKEGCAQVYSESRSSYNIPLISMSDKLILLKHEDLRMEAYEPGHVRDSLLYCLFGYTPYYDLNIVNKLTSALIEFFDTVNFLIDKDTFKKLLNKNPCLGQCFYGWSPNKFLNFNIFDDIRLVNKTLKSCPTLIASIYAKFELSEQLTLQFKALSFKGKHKSGSKYLMDLGYKFISKAFESNPDCLKYVKPYVEYGYTQSNLLKYIKKFGDTDILRTHIQKYPNLFSDRVLKALLKEDPELISCIKQTKDLVCYAVQQDASVIQYVPAQLQPIQAIVHWVTQGYTNGVNIDLLHSSIVGKTPRFQPASSAIEKYHKTPFDKESFYFYYAPFCTPRTIGLVLDSNPLNMAYTPVRFLAKKKSLYLNKILKKHIAKFEKLCQQNNKPHLNHSYRHISHLIYVLNEEQFYQVCAKHFNLFQTFILKHGDIVVSDFLTAVKKLAKNEDYANYLKKFEIKDLDL